MMNFHGYICMWTIFLSCNVSIDVASTSLMYLLENASHMGLGQFALPKSKEAYAKDVIQVHLGALIEDKNDLLAEWFCLKTYTDGHTPLICSNGPTLQMNTMPFDMDGVCTIQGDCIPHPADMRSTIKIIEKSSSTSAVCCPILHHRQL